MLSFLLLADQAIGNQCSDIVIPQQCEGSDQPNTESKQRSPVLVPVATSCFNNIYGCRNLGSSLHPRLPLQQYSGTSRLIGAIEKNTYFQVTTLISKCLYMCL
ncbi:hypothetical protein XELAEV_18016022mg [Xenopus laevis]|uniref:Uncharacterized protein n=1 Tax=Xenopus laevis TaxID=8355 RepID=A0A974DKR2_XENLA|nr:hypothetical protein XELAEV_18016022mg [Xenopus laevis]